MNRAEDFKINEPVMYDDNQIDIYTIRGIDVETQSLLLCGDWSGVGAPIQCSWCSVDLVHKTKLVKA